MVTTKQITGTVVDKAIKESRNGQNYIELKIQDDPGSEYATTVRAFDEEVVAQCTNIKKGATVILGISETKGEYQGREVTYRNVVAVVSTEEGRTGSDSSPTIKPQSQNTAIPKPVQQASVGGIGQIDPNQMRIMRQSTLHYACVLMSPMIREFTHPDGNTLAPDIKGAFIPEKLIVDIMGKTTVELARKFLEYVISGEMPLYSAEDCYEPLNWPLPPSFVPRVKQESQTEPIPSGIDPERML